MKAQVYEGDPRLSHATSVTIVNRRPTRYGATSELEHHAEGAASVATGIEIPFEEAAVFVPSHISDDGARANFARGYHPASQTQRVVAKAMGARQGTIPAEMIDQPEVVITRDRPENDSLMQRLYRRARMEPILPRRKMISILARTTASRSR